MKEWILSIGTTVLLTTIISLILPDGKIGKFIKGIFLIIVLLVILKPLANIKDSGLSDMSIFVNTETNIQSEYLNYIYDKKIKKHEEVCEKIIENIGIYKAKTSIQYSISEMGMEIQKVNINLKNSVIISDKEHIDIIEEIKANIMSYLNIENEKLVIYE